MRFEEHLSRTGRAGIVDQARQVTPGAFVVSRELAQVVTPEPAALDRATVAPCICQSKRLGLFLATLTELPCVSMCLGETGKGPHPQRRIGSADGYPQSALAALDPAFVREQPSLLDRSLGDHRHGGFAEFSDTLLYTHPYGG